MPRWSSEGETKGRLDQHRQMLCLGLRGLYYFSIYPPNAHPDIGHGNLWSDTKGTEFTSSSQIFIQKTFTKLLHFGVLSVLCFFFFNFAVAFSITTTIT